MQFFVRGKVGITEDLIDAVFEAEGIDAAKAMAEARGITPVITQRIGAMDMPTRCRNCAHTLAGESECPACGKPPTLGKEYCPACGERTALDALKCTHCEESLMPRGATTTLLMANGPEHSPHSELILAILGLSCMSNLVAIVILGGLVHPLLGFIPAALAIYEGIQGWVMFVHGNRLTKKLHMLQVASILYGNFVSFTIGILGLLSLRKKPAKRGGV